MQSTALTIVNLFKNGKSIFHYKTDKKAANVMRGKSIGNPKDYGIMASSYVTSHPLGLIPFPFVFPLSVHNIPAFFFPVFLLEKIARSESEQTGRK
ncbi:hypothetical protein R1T16_01650 [Flavobacterium sp. DG1-102-2]|uniref:hypothetical protein n=1 Tax=Flavobacterium sp. DG1-102-2 TaxID=3081663 RepID=UPI0029498F43|nr:hypothetical protein [Flavobacterium sp. DG1-102-2]MDV6167110.1 hypothetical protein [Flavobacterium sp. DG1-102-2]